MIDPITREISVSFAQTIARELMRSDQDYFYVDHYGPLNTRRLIGVAAAGQITQAGEDVIERYVRRAIEADRRARTCHAAE